MTPGLYILNYGIKCIVAFESHIISMQRCFEETVS